MLEKGTLVHTKGIGASGSFKIAIRSHTIHLKLIEQRKDPPIVQEYHHILALCVCVCVFSGLSFVAPAFMRREKSGQVRVCSPEETDSEEEQLWTSGLTGTKTFARHFCKE